MLRRVKVGWPKRKRFEIFGQVLVRELCDGGCVKRTSKEIKGAITRQSTLSLGNQGRVS